ncbi:MAG: glycosyltransferase family 2 protein, partial [Pseudomonadota bacterium]
MPPSLQAVLPQATSSSDLGLAPGRGHRILVGSAIVLGLAAILFVMMNGELFRPIRQSIEDGNLSASVLQPSLILASMGFLMLTLRTLLWFIYRPFEAATYQSAPTMTVVIPAYNEGPMVQQSIDSVAAASYPRGRLEILVVDDGSTDDTWEHIQLAAARHPGLVSAVRLERNQGKRTALATGFRAARGAILVTIDSDSVIERG